MAAGAFSILAAIYLSGNLCAGSALASHGSPAVGARIYRLGRFRGGDLPLAPRAPTGLGLIVSSNLRACRLMLTQELRQLADIRRNPPRLVAGEQVSR